MKIPSLKYLYDEAFKSAKRFPLTLLCAIIAVAISVYLVDFENELYDRLFLINLILTNALGLVLFFSIKVYKEKVTDSKLSLWVLNAIGFVVLVLIYLSLPNANDTSNISQPYIRYAVYNIVAHLLVSFAPFIRKGEINGFWQYNKMLFLRFCLSVLYSGFVYIGLTLALTALNLLFDADIQGETFFQLFILVIGLFNTWFFVSGIEINLQALDKESNYPKGLKVFTQYVLLPLLILYLLILYAYVFKIIGLWDWPKGIVSYMITIVSVLGILAFLLIYPYGKNEKHHWISKFSKFYYYTLLPLSVVLFIAIGIRISDYGLTVNRYIIVELGVWLLFISSYFIIGSKNIKMIPISLSILILFTSFGPWGIFSTAEKSQVDRIKNILTNSGILTDGKVINEPVLTIGKDSLFMLGNKYSNQLLLNDSMQNEVYSILNYLDDYHGFKEVDNWFSQNPDSIFQVLKDSSIYVYASEQKIRMELLGLEYRYNRDFNFKYSKRQTYNIEKKPWQIVRTTGYDYLLTVNYKHYSRNERKDVFVHEDHVFKFSESDEQNWILVSELSDTLRFDLGDLFEKLSLKYKSKSNSRVEESEMLLNDSVKYFSAKLQLENIQTESRDTLVVNSFMGKIYLKIH